VNIDVAVTDTGLDGGHGGITHDGADQAGTAARDDDVDEATGLNQMSDRGAIRTRQKLNGILGQSLINQRRTQSRHQRFVGLDRRGRTTKQRSISRLESQPEGIDGHVRTSLVHHTDDTERNAATINEEVLAYVNGAIKGARRFEGVQMDADSARMLHLLRVSQALPAPSDAQKRAELAATAAKLEGMYGKGKYCGKDGKGKGHGTVAVRVLGAGLRRISLIDDGIGIPADKRDKVFEPFQRAGQETGPIEGTGIGLTISKRLAEMMEGRVGFSSEVDRGSEFWIDVPIHRRATEDAVRPAATTGPSSLASGDAVHKVVYVEDNPSNIAFMRELLADLPGIELVTAPSAEIGLDLVRAHHPDVVIMDVNLPGMSGIEATEKLRTWPDTKDIPVIGLSAAALVKDTSRAQGAGFYRYLTKPVKVGELIAVLEELLQRAP